VERAKNTAVGGAQAWRVARPTSSTTRPQPTHPSHPYRTPTQPNPPPFNHPTAPPQVEKWQLLLHALGLEIITGAPAAFSQSSNRYYQQRNAVTGVHVALTGAAAHDALEKIVYLLLPSQNAFEGLLVRQLDRAGNMHFKVSSMVNLPDYEELFETFEGLGSVDVNLTLRGVAKRAGRSQVLLTGLQLPVLTRRLQIGGAQAAEEVEGSEEDE